MDYNETFVEKDPRSIVLEILLSRKAEVEKMIKEMRAYHRENKGSLFGDDCIEEVDRAGNEISNQTYYSLLERKTQELQRLEDLVRNISQNEEFGMCEDCEEEIGYERLMAMPDVTRCIECQRDFEKGGARDRNSVKYSFNQGQQDERNTDDTSENHKTLVRKNKLDLISDNDLNEIELDVTIPTLPNKQKSSFPATDS
ncbi:TraR/DksA family transcriptional regulator [Thermodesulfobacteriota bacterium]